MTTVILLKNNKRLYMHWDMLFLLSMYICSYIYSIANMGINTAIMKINTLNMTMLYATELVMLTHVQ